MAQTIIAFFSAFPPELAVFLIAMTPVLEQRVALPLAILAYHMPPFKALAITIVGNLIPILFLLAYAERFYAWVHKNAHTLWGSRWLRKLKQAQDSFARYEKYGLIGLAIFIILPIPGSGIFTGTMIAFLMGVSFKDAWPYIVSAVIGSALVTLAVSVGVEKII